MKLLIDPRCIDFSFDSCARRQLCKLAFLMGMLVTLATPLQIAANFGAIQDDDVVVTSDPEWAKIAGRAVETFLITKTYVPGLENVGQVPSWDEVYEAFKARSAAEPYLSRMKPSYVQESVAS